MAVNNKKTTIHSNTNCFPFITPHVIVRDWVGYTFNYRVILNVLTYIARSLITKIFT